MPDEPDLYSRTDCFEFIRALAFRTVYALLIRYAEGSILTIAKIDEHERRTLEIIKSIIDQRTCCTPELHAIILDNIADEFDTMKELMIQVTPSLDWSERAVRGVVEEGGTDINKKRRDGKVFKITPQ